MSERAESEMSEDRIEAAARALARLTGRDPDELTLHPAQKSWEEPNMPAWQHWEEEARAALKAADEAAPPGDVHRVILKARNLIAGLDMPADFTKPLELEDYVLHPKDMPCPMAAPAGDAVERVAEAIWRSGKWPPYSDLLRFDQLAEELQDQYRSHARAALSAAGRPLHTHVAVWHPIREAWTILETKTGRVVEECQPASQRDEAVLDEMAHDEKAVLLELLDDRDVQRRIQAIVVEDEEERRD